MYLIYGKGEVWFWLAKLLDVLDKEYMIVDDLDFDENLAKNCQNIIASPGIPPKHFIYQKYKSKILSELNFIWKILPFFCKKNLITIWITGTNGKSTTSRIIYNILKKTISDYDIYICGNFKPSISSQIADIIKTKYISTNYNSDFIKKNILVIEVSSFWLYDLDDFCFDYSMITNLSPDHLNWHIDLEDYYNSKFNIIRNTNFGLITDQVALYQEKFIQKSVQIFDSLNMEIFESNLIWKHNQKNINMSVLLFKKIIEDFGWNIDFNFLKSTIRQINPLPHRFQFAKTIKNIKFWDDAISSDTDAFLSAISNFDSKILVIVWWADKGEDYSILDNVFLQKVWFGVCLGTQMADKFFKQFDRLWIPSVLCRDLDSAIHCSIDNAKKYNLTDVLFSPACASFDIFENANNRWDLFIQKIDILNKFA